MKTPAGLTSLDQTNTMEDNPLVSIVLLSYNQKEFLREAIESVLRQSYQNKEIIVMDGGSSDGSDDLIREYDNDFAYCHIGPDGGAAAALNAGFEKANGQIYAYLNSDDVLLPGTVATWVDAFKKTKADVVYGDIRIIGPKGEDAHLPGKRVSLFKASPYSKRRMAVGACTIPQQASAWKSEVHHQIGGFVESNISSWDGEFFVDAAIKGFRFADIPKVLALFRVHSDSISGVGKHAEAWARDSKRMESKWMKAGFDITGAEKFLLQKWGQMLRMKRYLLER